MIEEKVPQVCLDYQTNCMAIEEIRPVNQKEDSQGIIITSGEPQEFMDQIPKMMSLEVEDKKQEVEYLGEYQVQYLGLQVIMKSQDEFLVMTLQCQMMKGKHKVNPVVQPQ